MTLLARACTTDATVDVNVVAKANHSEVRSITLHWGADLPLGCYSLCGSVFVGPHHTSLEVWEQVKAPNGIMPGASIAFASNNKKRPRASFTLSNNGLVHVARSW